MPSYVDFVRAELEYRASPQWATDRAYFVEKYRDVEPALFARSGSIRSRRQAPHTLRVNPETARRIRDTGRSIFAFTAAASASTWVEYIATGTSSSGSRSSTGRRMPNYARSAA